MKKLLLIVITLLSFNPQAEGMSESELSTILTVAPFYLTTEAVVDVLTKNMYEEAGDIVSDGVITEEEYEEMSVELQAELKECMDIFADEFGYDEVKCLKQIASYDN